jgi:hypothetical protein
MISKRNLLVDGDAEAGDDRLKVNDQSTHHESGTINLGKPLPSTQTSELCFLSVQLEPVRRHPCSNLFDARLQA